MALNVVLVEPEIPQNTGNIARTCAATGARLHLIRPLGFAVTDKNIKRAGMDYWQDVEVIFWDDFESFRKKHPPETSKWVLATTKASLTYDLIDYSDESFLLFGRESAGLNEELIRELSHRAIRIPMAGETRSLNLSNAVSIILYEALRSQGFPGLEPKGQLRGPGPI